MKGKIANIAIVILSIILVFNVLILVYKWSYIADRGSVTEYDLLSAVDYGDYIHLIKLAYQDDDKTDTTQIGTECHAVANYFEAATLYKVYNTLGDAKRANRYEDEMEDVANQLGDFAFFKEEILGLLELE